MNGDADSIVATVRKERFRKPDSNWAIVQTDVGIVKGVIPFQIATGDRLSLQGWWGTSDFNGEKEFSFRYAQIAIPENSLDMLHYAVEITTGLGPRAEHEIWTAYGESWPKHPDLDGIPGITAKTRAAWVETLDRIVLHAERTRAIAWLLAHAATMRMAELAWEQWEAMTISTVTADPYSLAYLPRYGFHDVDLKVRHTFQIADDDERRIDACLIYCANKLMDQGSTVIEASWLSVEVAGYIVMDNGRMGDSVRRLINRGELVELDGHMLTTSRYYRAERMVADRFLAGVTA